MNSKLCKEVGGRENQNNAAELSHKGRGDVIIYVKICQDFDCQIISIYHEYCTTGSLPFFNYLFSFYDQSYCSNHRPIQDGTAMLGFETLRRGRVRGHTGGKRDDFNFQHVFCGKQMSYLWWKQFKVESLKCLSRACADIFFPL